MIVFTISPPVEWLPIIAHRAIRAEQFQHTAVFDSTESVSGAPVAEEEVPITVNHSANARKNTGLMTAFLSNPFK
jgi:hypothetical protein